MIHLVRDNVDRTSSIKVKGKVDGTKLASVDVDASATRLAAHLQRAISEAAYEQCRSSYFSQLGNTAPNLRLKLERVLEASAAVQDLHSRRWETLRENAEKARELRDRAREETASIGLVDIKRNDARRIQQAIARADDALAEADARADRMCLRRVLATVDSTKATHGGSEQDKESTARVERIQRVAARHRFNIKQRARMAKLSKAPRFGNFHT